MKQIFIARDGKWELLPDDEYIPPQDKYEYERLPKRTQTERIYDLLKEHGAQDIRRVGSGFQALVPQWMISDFGRSFMEELYRTDDSFDPVLCATNLLKDKDV